MVALHQVAVAAVVVPLLRVGLVRDLMYTGRQRVLPQGQGLRRELLRAVGEADTAVAREAPSLPDPGRDLPGDVAVAVATTTDVGLGAVVKTASTTGADRLVAAEVAGIDKRAGFKTREGCFNHRHLMAKDAGACLPLRRLTE